MKTRLAPTPSGYLHRGNAYNFWLVQRLARASGGVILLRIDDLDRSRVRTAYLQDIFDSLNWLGISWDDGPRDVVDFRENWSQHLRMARYREVLERLRATGHVFACGLSRRQIAERSTDGRYPVSARDQGVDLEAKNVAWRLRVPEGTVMCWRDADGTQREVDLYTTMRDPVVRRRDGLPAYQLASLVDDQLFEIDTVVRGHDLLPSTAFQRYLAELLGYANFLQNQFYHHPLLVDLSGQKLSKSEGADSLLHLRSVGQPAAHLLASFSHTDK